jgi:hypothetical protein
MPTQVPGELTAVSIAVLNGGAVAEAVVNERTDCFARLHADGAWSDWSFVVSGVRDVSVTADASQDENSALIAVVVLVPLPLGAFAVEHTLYQGAFYRLSAAGVVPADL